LKYDEITKCKMSTFKHFSKRDDGIHGFHEQYLRHRQVNQPPMPTLQALQKHLEKNNKFQIIISLIPLGGLWSEDTISNKVANLHSILMASLEDLKNP
jgi:hypothetical protein